MRQVHALRVRNVQRVGVVQAVRRMRIALAEVFARRGNVRNGVLVIKSALLDTDV